MLTIFSLYQASLKEFMRDRLALFWTLAFPILFILLFGLIFSGSGSPSYTVGLVNQDTGALGQAIAQGFGHVKPFTIKTGTLSNELDTLKKGQLDMVVMIPAGLSQHAQSNHTTGIRVYYDPSNQANAQVELGIVQQVLTGFNQRITHVTPPLTLAPQPIQTKPLTTVDFLVPGILAMSLMQLGLFGTTQQLVSLREQQVLRRLGATPLPRWKLLVSQVLLRLTIALAQTALIVGIGVAAFHVQVQGNPLALLGLVLLGAVMFISLGYFIAAVSPTTESANGIVSAVNFPMLFLSGIFFPLALFPAFLTPIVRIIPLTYLADAIRQVMVSSVPDFPMTVDLAVLAAWIVACTLLSVRLFKWE
jgi:ABC-2 type transport system permease protein